MAARIRSLRVHGCGLDKDDSVHIGINGRLDTLQAAVLLAKLEIFDDELARRQRAADHYAEGLSDVAVVPTLMPDTTSSWACYTVRISHRDRVREGLAKERIASAVYYRQPLHRRTAYRGYPRAPSGLPVSEHLSEEVLSLPIHPYLDESAQDRVIDALYRQDRL